ncbi:MAG: HNH endonuclease, partial [Nitrospira sp.]|nr:HNH endonuclease [Nitrospira sp.]
MASIKDKDQKILWGRSAGMCGICRVKLTLDDGGGDPTTVGAMC